MMPVCKLCGSEKAQSSIANRGSGIFTPENLAKSIQEGCHACMTLRDGVQCFESLDPSQTLVERISLFRRSSDKALLVIVYYLDFDEKYILQFLETQAWTASNSMASLSWVQNRLQKCSQDHQHCHAVAQSLQLNFPPMPISTNVATSLEPETTLPTRVLDIGNSAENTIKLVETQGTMTGHYICLSHCWGKKQPLVTTKENIEAWKTQIPSTMFPKTFQDAITFTRNLSLRYLWIDSLCIIQNDSQDWQHQAGKMAEIYQNSYLTLAATASRDCDGGLFYDFSPRSETHVLTGLGISGEHIQYYVQEITPHWSDITVGSRNEKRDFPLLTRAWTYQERLLAPRVLHFCLDELLWECNEVWACQCGSFHPATNPKEIHSDILRAAHIDRSNEKTPANDGQPAMRNDETFIPTPESDCTPAANALAEHKPHLQTPSISPRKPTEETNIDEEKPNSDDLCDSWHAFVSSYSKLELTYDSDRLPALAGLAEQMHRFRRDRYLAGLWENDLVESLGWWSQDHDERPLGRPTMHHPPTWSWASTNQEIGFSGRVSTIHHLCAIDEVDCSPLDHANPRGGVAHGYLVITGLLTDGKLGYHDGKWTFNLPIRMKRRDRGYWNFVPDYDFAFPGPDQMSEGQKLSCLPLNLEREVLTALIVTCVDVEKKHYKRIGLLDVGCYPWGIAQLLPQWQPGEAELDRSALGHTRELCYLVQSVRRVREESWTAFTETFERGKINDIFPHEQGDWTGTIVLVRMTPQRAKQVIAPRVVRDAFPIPLVESRKLGKWFLTAENAKRKERGEHYVKYFGVRITIL